MLGVYGICACYVHSTLPSLALLEGGERPAKAFAGELCNFSPARLSAGVRIPFAAVQAAHDQLPCAEVQNEALGAHAAGLFFMGSSSAPRNQPKSLFLIFVGQSGLIHHHLNPHVCCVINGDESVEKSV